MTMTASDKYTYQRTVLCLARVLAGIQPTPWEKVHSTCDIPDIRVGNCHGNRLFTSHTDLERRPQNRHAWAWAPLQGAVGR